MKWRKKSLIGLLTIFAAALLIPITVSAHGYVEQQPSRAFLCAQGVNQSCGKIQWQPQSTETLKGFPEAGVRDGQFASANGIFPELDEQSENRWAKVSMEHGKQTFQWHLTAAHSTAKWHYYITKENWDPNAPLARDQFELKPFYEKYDNGVVPGQKVQHEVIVPERKGYHVILAVWDVADTRNAFYHVIDADFSGSGTNPNPTPDPDSGTNPNPTPDPDSGTNPEPTPDPDSGTNPEPTPDPDSGTNPEPTPNPDPDTNHPCEGDTWDSTATYLKGNQVIYGGLLYEAKWWTKGNQPDISDAWMLLSKDAVRTWNSNAVYYGGDRVQYEGVIYEAQWWTTGDIPTNLGVWKVV